MTTKIELLWRDALQFAQEKPVELNSYRLTRIAPETRFDIYAGIDATSFVLLALGVRVRPPNIVVESLSLDYFRQQRHDGSWLMVLRLCQNELKSVFGRLCQDLVNEADCEPNEEALVALFEQRLSLWKRLFQRGGDGLLQPNEIMGLLAEMIVLENIVESGNRALHESIAGWTGPFRADQDFFYSNHAIEVKAISPDSDLVSISSLQQLDCRVPMHLVVVVLRRATPGEAGTLSLNAMSAKIEALAAPSPQALTTFRNRLLEASYVEHNFYDSVSFELIRIDSYKIAEAFPRLLSAMVPEGIVSATYSIDLSEISEFEEDYHPC